MENGLQRKEKYRRTFLLGYQVGSPSCHPLHLLHHLRAARGGRSTFGAPSPLKPGQTTGGRRQPAGERDGKYIRSKATAINAPVSLASSCALQLYSLSHLYAHRWGPDMHSHVGKLLRRHVAHTIRAYLQPIDPSRARSSMAGRSRPLSGNSGSRCDAVEVPVSLSL